MEKYKCVIIGEYADDTEDMLNKLASKGWKVICSYAKKNQYLILEREI